jgi:hypothetical protein
MMVLAHLRRRWCLSGGEGFGFLSPSRLASSAGFRRFWVVEMTIFLYADVENWRRNHGGVSWAQTCALVIHIWTLAHKWQGRSSGTRKRRSVTKIHTTNARAGSNRRWRQRLSSYPSSAYARRRDRRAVAKAIDVASRIIPASDAVELRGRARAWAIDARRRVCRPCGVRVWRTRAKTSLLDRVCCATDVDGAERRMLRVRSSWVKWYK